MRLEFPKLEAITLPVGRLYIDTITDPEHIHFYPSITTVLHILSERDIKKWQKRIGQNEADKITNKAAGRGTAMHTIIENYLDARDEGRVFKPDILEKGFQHFHLVKKYVDQIDNIICQEQTLFSNWLGVAGRTDCIGYFNGKLSVIDFKTSLKMKPKKWIKSYFLQTAFYGRAFTECVNLLGMDAPTEPIEQSVIIMATDDGNGQLFIEDLKPYEDDLLTTIDEWYEIKGPDFEYHFQDALSKMS